MRYFPETFRTELIAFAKSRPAKSTCPHCQIPRRRRVEFDRIPHDLPPRFRCGWYLTTLLEQVLFRYFREHLTRWHDFMGVLPLPVVPAGMGCVRAMRPGDLLKGSEMSEPWAQFLPEAARFLEGLPPAIGIGPRTLFERLAHDKDFNRAPGSPEALLYDLVMRLGN
jgi:hypothetical protein